MRFYNSINSKVNYMKLIMILILLNKSFSVTEINEISSFTKIDYQSRKYIVNFSFKNNSNEKNSIGDIIGISTSITDFDSYVEKCELNLVMNYDFEEYVSIPVKKSLYFSNKFISENSNNPSNTNVKYLLYCVSKYKKR